MKITLRDLIITKKLLPNESVDIYIKAGKILVNDEMNRFPYSRVNKNATIRIKHSKQWVSRGALKLLFALKEFAISPKKFNCIDIGSSTGGFTDVLLYYGAKIVYCVDSGSNQLSYSLRQDERTVVLEKTNLKSLVPNMFVNKIDLIVSDVSFISLKHVFNVSENLLKKNKIMIVLIKPEFEASSNLVEKGGYVQEKHHKIIIEDIIKYAKTKMFKNIGIIESPILGKKSKNKEYLAIFKRF